MNAAFPLFEQIEQLEAPVSRQAPLTCRPPAGPQTVEQARVELDSAAPARKSRRWIVDIAMLIVGSLVGVYFGNATVRAHALAHVGKWIPVAHAQTARVAAPTSATHEVVIVHVQRARGPELTRVASDSASVSDPSTKQARPPARPHRSDARRPSTRTAK